MKKLVIILFLLNINALMSEEIIDKILDNGIRVIIKENNLAPVATIKIYVCNTGSIYEEQFLGSGISHYCEHLVATGSTTKKTSQEQEKIIQSLGGCFNAYTSNDHTCYYISTSKLYVNEAIDFISDWMQNCTFTEEEVIREKGVILNEIAKEEDDPNSKIYHLYNSLMFKKHPCYFPVIGTKKLFEQIKKEDLFNFYKEKYIPQNMIIVSVGDFDANKILEQIKKAFDNFEPKFNKPIVLPQESEQINKRYTMQEMDIQSTYLSMGFRTVNITHEDLYPLDVLSFILSKGESAILNKVIKNEKGLVSDIDTFSYTPKYDAGNFKISAILEYENLESTQKAILEEIYKLKTKTLQNKELSKAKKQMISEYVFSHQTVEQEADMIGLNAFTTEDPLFHKKYLEKISEVKKEDIKRVVNKYFCNDKLNIAVIIPKEKNLSKKIIEKKEIQQEKIQKQILKNGITLLYKKNSNLPFIYFGAYLKGGTLYENEKNNGIFNFMTQMFMKGTKKRTALKIAQEINNLGINFSSGAEEDYFYCTVSTLKEDLEKSLDIFSDIFLNSIFPKQEIEKEKKIILSQIKQQEDDAFQQAELFFRENFYSTNPYKFSILGTKQSINKINQNDILEIYNKYCVSNNLVITVFGNIEIEEIMKKIENKFTKIKQGKINFPIIEKKQILSENIEKKLTTQKQQAIIMLGYPTIKINDDTDAYTLRVIDAITSGVYYPSGWLHQSLRNAKLVYIVHAWNQFFMTDGFYGIMAATNPENIDKVINIIKEKQELLKNTLVEEKELERAKRNCIVMENLYYSQQISSQAKLSAIYELSGLGYNYRNDYEKKINEITSEQVKKVANKYFGKYHLVITTPNKN
ncbi:MAG: pitrilysin family protein [bacterium]